MGTVVKRAYRKKFVIGMLFILVVLVFFLKIFSMMGWTNKVDEYLGDTAKLSHGWSYEILTDGKAEEVTPEFLDEYTVTMPEPQAEAVKITRTFTETLPYASLELYIYKAGVEVFVDENLVYSDFQKKERNEEGFLILEQEDLEQTGSDMGKSVRFSLPEDYTGRELTVITYFGEGRESTSPVYPSIGNDETSYVCYVVETVFPVGIMVLCAILAILILVIFVLDIPKGEADARVLLLSLFFVMLFLGEAYGSITGTASVLSEHMNLSFLQELYMAPLYLYLALHLTKWRKYLVSSGVILWFLYEGTRMFLNVKEGELIRTGRNGFGALVLAGVIGAALLWEYISRRHEMKEKITAYHLFYGLTAVIAVIVRLMYGAREWEGDVGMYLTQMFFSVSVGGYIPLVHFLSDVCGSVTMIIVFLEFIRRTVLEKEMFSALKERSRLTLEGYNRMVKAENATSSVRHEMRHHMIALMGMLKEGENKRAQDYITSVTGALDALPSFRYSQNILVNVIAGEYLGRAEEQGIRVEYSLGVPAELEMADEDLSVFLTNMLENALEACERMAPEQERYIRVKMHVYDHFLFISCNNSKSEQAEESIHDRKKKKHRSHGYGMAAMSRIAEKYGSILKVEQNSSEFTVKTNLCLSHQES